MARKKKKIKNKIMATIKSHTDLSQSKTLSKILPLESADMYYISGDKDDICFGSGVYEEIADWLSDGTPRPADIPCWSLAALLGVLPTLDGRNAVLCKDIRYDEWHICYHSTATLSVIDTERYDNPVDACYEAILKLKENNLL